MTLNQLARLTVHFCLPTCMAIALSFSAPARSPLAELIQEHCVDCHGPDTRKAGLRLDTLSEDLSDPSILTKWALVHDRIKSGEMPPDKKERPPQEAVRPALGWLDEKLRTASLQMQREAGRVQLRRLNATEYENTMRDLMGTRVELKSALPQENSSAGFDNVSATLELSATHLLLFQEAAEKAVRSAIPINPPIPFKVRRTGREMSEKGGNFKQTLTRTCMLREEALVIYGKLPRYGLACTADAPARGRYKVRMLIAAVGAENQPVAAAFLTVGRGPEDPAVYECRDIQPGPPSIIETELDLDIGQAFVVNLLSNWNVSSTKKPIAEYEGPGLLIEWLEIEGPAGEYPPASYRQLFGDIPLKTVSEARALKEGRRPPVIALNRYSQQWLTDPLIPVSEQPREDAERVIRAFLPRAFRRPVGEELQRHYVGLVHRKLDEGDAFYEAVLYGLKAILSSPHFLLFLEPEDAAVESGKPDYPTKLDDFALASRLSYFLWSGPPDTELNRVATQGTLSQPTVLRAQVERMLNTEQAHRFTENFLGQWLDLRKMNATIPDPNLYGEFDGLLLWSMPRETHSFFEEVLRENLSVLEFVDSNWTMLNARLASHYGIGGVVGNHFRRVALPPGSHRGGVMTHGSVLKVTADGTTTSPVLRGKWILERIIGRPPNPPPPDVPALEPDIRGATTIRQQLEKHRTVASCNACHQHIDPPGFALESFDPIGGYRDFYRTSARVGKSEVAGVAPSGRSYFRGPNVEKGGLTSEGRAFEDIESYKQILLEQKEQIVRNLAGKLLVFATGADVQYADREVLDGIVQKVSADRYGLRSLVHEVVQSRPFLHK